MKNFIKEVARIAGDSAKISDSKVTISRDGLTLEIYDSDNLLGFTLEGAVNGKTIYIVHDTDNYNRDAPQYSTLYEDARDDAIHVCKAFVNGKITTTTKERKGWLRKKEESVITIPDKNGLAVSYVSPTVNAVNFLEGYSK